MTPDGFEIQLMNPMRFTVDSYAHGSIYLGLKVVISTASSPQRISLDFEKEPALYGFKCT